jgi:hypothetical protein
MALFEYLLQVPANRIGYQQLNIGQVKILQGVITLGVFIPFSMFSMKEPLKVDYVWATLCIMGAVFFVFRSKLVGQYLRSNDNNRDCFILIICSYKRYSY